MLEIVIRFNEENGQIGWQMNPAQMPVVQLLGIIEMFKAALMMQAQQTRVQQPLPAELSRFLK